MQFGPILTWKWMTLKQFRNMLHFLLQPNQRRKQQHHFPCRSRFRNLRLLEGPSTPDHFRPNISTLTQNLQCPRKQSLHRHPYREYYGQPSAPLIYFANISSLRHLIPTLSVQMRILAVRMMSLRRLAYLTLQRHLGSIATILWSS